ncbi:hypothetical protein AB0G04_31855 [Actinoplanes sp. NPDC023801]|uniref:hypothetical protein n=1 Tax=Actinoplanes sp. NPDC023801 TaxID=3154595 RepID=UPI0033DFEEDC
MPTAASAAPGVPAAAVTAPAEPPDRTAMLKKALLTKADMPPGYEMLDTDFYEPLMREMFGQAGTTGDPCAMADALSDVSASPMAMPIQSGELIKTIEPAKTIEPVKTVDPVKTGPAPQDEPEAPAGPPTAMAIFDHADEGSMAMEVLSAIGEKPAAAAIAQLRTMLKDCPEIDMDGAELTVRALDWQQRLGDEAIAVEIVVRAKFAGIDVTMRAKAVQVAYRDVALTVGLMGAEDPADKRLKRIARTAVRKLVTSEGVSTK